ncbi:MAG TPA: SPOR domain-containing protein [Thermodesulfobacteriota bacterium]|nr:SPOR domain-containing protein [Thermodesulfobacteriota bacterium]
MKDEQSSEEKLMSELDRLYRHVADLESSQEAVEQNDHPYKRDQISDLVASVHGKVIPFPGQKIDWSYGELSLEELMDKRKPPRRRYLTVGSFSVICLALILIFIIAKVMIAPRTSEKGEPHQLTFPIPSKPSAPVQKGENLLQNTEEKQQEAETQPHETTEPSIPLSLKRYYTVQIGVFLDWGNTSELIEALQKKDLEAYWVEVNRKDGATLYKVFSGYFTDRNEATKFMKEKGILKNYPGSFVSEISSEEVKHQMP